MDCKHYLNIFLTPLVSKLYKKWSLNFSYFAKFTFHYLVALTTIVITGAVKTLPSWMLLILRSLARYILLLIYFTVSAISMPIEDGVLPELIAADNFLANAVVKAKRMYLDNGAISPNVGNIWDNNTLPLGAISVIDTNMMNYSRIKRLAVLSDYRIVLQFAHNHPQYSLQNTRIVLVPGVNDGDIHITRYSCYTDFDYKVKPQASGLVQPGINGHLSIFTRYLGGSANTIEGCIYIDPTSLQNIVFN